MNAIGALLTLAISVGVYVLRPRWAACALIAAVCYLPQTQQVSLGPAHFSAARLVLLAGFIRIWMRKEYRGVDRTGLEMPVVIFAATVSIIYIIRQASLSAVVYELGTDFDILLSYFVFRSLFNADNNIPRFLADLTVVLLPFAALMLLESFTSTNPFVSVFGAVGDADFRNGRIRAQGPFQSCITAGVFGASLTPLYLGLWRSTPYKRRGLLGLAACGVIAITSYSSGAAIALILSIAFWFLWPLRGHMRLVRWSIIFAVAVLALVMNSPVWYIFARLSQFSGGGGYYRSELITQAFAHFGDWWLLGTDQTGDWMATRLDNGAADLTNQYIRAGVHGGLLGAIFFINILVQGFKRLGRSMRWLRERIRASHAERFLWAAGVMLAVHVVTILSVSYFDQMIIAWYMELALISALCAARSPVFSDPEFVSKA